jgi:hypothetical protein
MIFRVNNALTESQIGCIPTQVHKGIEHFIGTQRKVFTKKAYYLVYTWYISSVYLSLCSRPAEHFRARFVSQALLAASDLDVLRIRCVLATDRPPMQGWQMPIAKC